MNTLFTESQKYLLASVSLRHGAKRRFISKCAILHTALHTTKPFSLMVYCTFAWQSACNITCV